MAYANKVGNVTFSHFVVSLATTAAVHFGEVKDPDSGVNSPINLEAAGKKRHGGTSLKTKRHFFSGYCTSFEINS